MTEYWHAWGGTVDGMNMTAVVGPLSTLHPSQKMLNDLGALANEFYYLKRWNHEPSDAEKDALEDLIPFIIREELDI